MIYEAILGTSLVLSTAVLPAVGLVLPTPVPAVEIKPLAEQVLYLNKRWPVESVSDGFADNILLAIHYLKGDIKGLENESGLDWSKVIEPFEVSFVLNPGEIFAFHKNVLPEFKDPKVTMNSEFMTYEGYKAVAGLGGNGVCHLASLMTWVSKEANLEVVFPASHSFAKIEGVPTELGTSIRAPQPNQNLYIKNNFEVPVTFVFAADSSKVDLKIIQK